MAVHVEVKQGQLLRRCPLARLRHQAARATSRAAPFCWWLAVRVGVGSPLARRRCALAAGQQIGQHTAEQIGIVATN